MEAEAAQATGSVPVTERLRDSRIARLVSRYPERSALAVIALTVVAIIVTKGLHDTAQTGLNGLALGSVYALGAVGLTLVYGILKLVNFAHGDFSPSARTWPTS